jgi:hypothetical protein
MGRSGGGEGGWYFEAGRVGSAGGSKEGEHENPQAHNVQGNLKGSSQSNDPHLQIR